MSNKIYIGNLSYRVSEDELQNLLSQFGQLTSVSLVKDRFSGQSKGFAFAEFDSSEAMNKAIEELDGADFLGRPLRVNVAEERKPAPQRREQRW